MTFEPVAHTDFAELPQDADIRLITVDMDGTLLPDDKTFPEELWPLLDQLAERGVTFAPASGRQCWSLLDLFERAHSGMTVIAENGAIVMRDGQEVSSVPMAHGPVEEVIRKIREFVATGVDAGLMMCGKVCGYVERGDQQFLDSVAPYYHRVSVVDDQIDVLRAMENGELDDDVIKLAVFCFDSVLPIAEFSMEPYKDTHQYVVSGYNWADLQTKGVDKGTAVRALQKKLGITKEQTLAFGDFHNDIGMLREAGYSFAMANAHPDVIAEATYIAPSNNDQGVLTVIRHLLNLE